MTNDELPPIDKTIQRLTKFNHDALRIHNDATRIMMNSRTTWGAAIDAHDSPDRLRAEIERLVKYYRNK